MKNITDLKQKKQEIRTGRHCVSDLHVHLVFVTKYRQQIFTTQHLKLMLDVFTQVCLDFKSDLVEFDGKDDHVHLLIYYPPQVQLSKLINSLKGVSSRLLRKNYPDINKWYYNNQALWSPSYFASSCGGPPIDVMHQYIEQQQAP